MEVKDEKARAWYEKETAEQTWSVRTLQRNIDSQYYYRLLSSQNTADVLAEMKQLTSDYQQVKQCSICSRRRQQMRLEELIKRAAQYVENLARDIKDYVHGRKYGLVYEAYFTIFPS